VTYTHVKVTIYPDGGIKRVRVIGRRVVLDDPTASVTVAPTSDANNHVTLNYHSSTDGAVASKAGEAPRTTTVPLLPLTPEAFAPYGQVLQAYSDHAAVPKGIRITPANGGTANKFHKLSLLHSTYPENSGATAGISIYRCKPLTDYAEDGSSPLKVLERHPFTNQAFIPMGRGNGDEAITDPADKYLVVVAKNGSNDKPDMQTLRGFVATATQGVVYNAGVWRKFQNQFLSVQDQCHIFRPTNDSVREGTCSSKTNLYGLRLMLM
jgi:allantoicase